MEIREDAVPSVIARRVRRWAHLALLALTCAATTAYAGGIRPANAGAVPGAAPAQSAAPALTADEWHEAAAHAAHFVAGESPASRLPFDPVPARAGRRTVLIDYIPSLPISMEGAPGDRDYYTRHIPTGTEPEGTAVKRFVIWQRPLPTGPWSPRLALPTNFAIDALRAQRIGADGFLLDLISISGRYWDWTRMLLDATAASAPDFHIAAEPDMSALKDATVQSLADVLTYFYQHPAGYKLADGRLLVVPFKPENRPLVFWQDLTAEMKRRGAPIALIAGSLALNDAPAYAPVSVGLSFWGGRDPAVAPAQLAAAKQLTAKSGLPVMLPVAPQDFRPKSAIFWEARNTEAYRTQWETAIKSDAPWVHLITWNDYSEGTEVAPSSTTQFLFYDLAAYYIAWYKTGAPPPIRRDALFYSYRRQLFDPASGDVGAPYRKLGTTPLANDVETLGFLRQPGTIEIQQGDAVRRSSYGAGLQTLRVPAQPGTPCFRLLRGGRDVIRSAGPFAIESSPRFKDGLYGGGSTLRPFVPVLASPVAPAGQTAAPPVPALPLPEPACHS